MLGDETCVRASAIACSVSPASNRLRMMCTCTLRSVNDKSPASIRCKLVLERGNVVHLHVECNRIRPQCLLQQVIQDWREDGQEQVLLLCVARVIGPAQIPSAKLGASGWKKWQLLPLMHPGNSVQFWRRVLRDLSGSRNGKHHARGLIRIFRQVRQLGVALQSRHEIDGRSQRIELETRG